MKWLAERFQYRNGPEDEDVISGFQDFIVESEALSTEVFEACVESIAHFHTRAEQSPQALIERLECDLRSISDGRESNICNFAEYLLLALACIKALARYPALDTWRSVSGICASHGRVGFILPLALVAQVRVEPDWAQPFISLMTASLNQAATEGPLCGQKARESYLASREVWQEEKSLTAVWSHHLWAAEDHYWHLWNRMEFEILSYLDLETYTQMLNVFPEPNAVQAALLAGRTDQSFSQWRKVLESTPPSFTVDGIWNGDLGVILLLDIALRQQVQGMSEVTRQKPSAEKDQLLDEMDSFSRLIIETLARRDDFPWLITQWGALLIKRAIAQDDPSSQQTPSPIHVYTSLILAIGPHAARLNPGVAPHEDPEHEIAWRYRALRTWLAVEGHGDFPAAAEVLTDWDIDADSWSQTAGRSLESQAADFMARQARRNLLASRLLALPFVYSSAPHENWVSLWERTLVLREITEFGDPDDESGWRKRASAEHLTVVAFDLGLSILDYIVSGAGAASNDDTSTKLFMDLFRACEEMRSIQTFDRQYWDRARIELALRRVFWAPPLNKGTYNLAVDTQPTVEGCLKAFHEDSIAFVKLIDLLLRNNVPTAVIQQALDCAQIRLEQALEHANRLHNLQPMKFPLSQGLNENLSKLVSFG
ncbi:MULTISPECIES: hypothetical protein [unclassified Pseudomonas]|uniref:hypothetical protein n=1 Tax=unclassified Pseudomonas TaxID=196821 RepID=UPI00244C7799|nr:MULTISPECIES: hypothetical protein [unclassified Pseudomonas]MDH0303355.1 hypothetical protein [Pseudomonas sp. GD04091]MDH1984578.1 hypothetical protein [Pseudomonas sp. GD03689]